MGVAFSVMAALADPGDWDGHMGDGGWMWVWGPAMMLLTVAVIGVVGFLLVRAGSAPRERSGSERARDILAERYARGELSTEEYRERLQAIE